MSALRELKSESEIRVTNIQQTHFQVVFSVTGTVLAVNIYILKPQGKWLVPLEEHLCAGSDLELPGEVWLFSLQKYQDK